MEIEHPQRPKVWPWFVAYSFALAAVYLLVAIAGLVVLILDPADLEMQPAEAKLFGIIMIVVGVLFTLPFAVAPFLPNKSWVWIYDLVLICIGLTSLCCIPFCIPLLIFWLKPETKLYFGRQT